MFKAHVSGRYLSPEGVTRRCGRDKHGYFDRDGNYFREGNDPRNHHGRLVDQSVLRRALPACTGDQDCEVHLGDCSLDDEPWVC